MSIRITHDSNAMMLIDKAIVTKDEFKTFCMALGLGMDLTLRLMQTDQSTRNYEALHFWEQQHASRSDFVAVLVAMKHATLAAQLGMADEYAAMISPPTAETFGQMSVKLYKSLTKDNMQEVLMLVGCTSAEAERKSSSGASFMSELALRAKFSKDQIDVGLFRNFPAVYKMLVNYCKATGTSTCGPVEPVSSMSIDPTPDRFEPTWSMSDTTLHGGGRKASKSNPFTVAQAKPQNLRTFVESNSADYKNICVQMNECEGWFKFLEINEMLTTKEAAEFVQKLRIGWQARTNNPTDEVFQLLTETKLQDLTYEQIWRQLKSIGNHDVSKAVEKWKSFCDATAETAKSSNKRTFTEASTLRGSLLELNICTPNNVDEALGKLTHPSIDITTLEDLKGMSKDELTSAGWSLKMAKDCVAKLASK